MTLEARNCCRREPVATQENERKKMKIKDVVGMLLKYDPELDIQLPTHYAWALESGVWRDEPSVIKFAKSPYFNCGDEGDLVPLDCVDECVAEAVEGLCNKIGVEYEVDEPSEKQVEVEKFVRSTIEYVHLFGV